MQRNSAKRIALGSRAEVPNLASQMRVAFCSMAWNTGSRSPGELEMTLRTSEVAVCCSSASVTSRVRACTSSNSRAFSMAITAWSAKVSISAIWLSVKGLRVSRATVMTPIATSIAEERYGKDRASSAGSVNIAGGELRVDRAVRHVDRATLARGLARRRSRPGLGRDRVLRKVGFEIRGWSSLIGRQVVLAVSSLKNWARVRLAQPLGSPSNGVENRLQLRR